MTVTGLDETLERTLDLSGIFVFAISGASLAARKRFDVVGIAVLATATALGGGILRDTLLGEHPPAALRGVAYLSVPLIATVLVLVGHRVVEQIRRPVLLFDAGGLGLFCVVGTAKALDAGVGVMAAMLLGTMTAVGGGVIRDTLAREVPTIFRADSALYAVPAAIGAGATAIAWAAGLFGAPAAMAIASGVFALRVLAMHFEWRAPSARGSRT